MPCTCPCDASGRLGCSSASTNWRDSRDARQLNVTLTPAGHDYARAVIAVTEGLNREIAGRVSPDQLAAADAVLRAALLDDDTRQRASQVPPPPGQPSG
jgi:hypothetical protein